MKGTLHVRMPPPPGDAVERLVRKQLVGAASAADLELRVLLHFDAAHRSRGTTASYYYLAGHLTMAMYLGQRLHAPAFNEQAVAAAIALNRAGQRSGALLGLTTGEYRAIQRALRSYFQVLPQIELGMMVEANRVAAVQAAAAVRQGA